MSVHKIIKVCGKVDEPRPEDRLGYLHLPFPADAVPVRTEPSTRSYLPDGLLRHPDISIEGRARRAIDGSQPEYP